MSDESKAKTDVVAELPRKPIPEGMENNEAFMEYRNLSRQERETLKTSQIEMPDLQRLASKEAQLQALTEVVETQVEVIQDLQRQNRNFKSALQQTSKQVLRVAQKGCPTEDAIRAIAGILINASGEGVAMNPPAANDDVKEDAQ